MLATALAMSAAITLAGGSQIPPTHTERPHDPWVFRSVLDGNARMLTVALSDEMWLAYDSQTCELTKAWKGGVEFDGAVYTTVHGPQPTSVGGAYTTHAGAGDAWTALRGTDVVRVETRYLGHRFVDDAVELMYELRGPDGARLALVNERPEFIPGDDGAALLERRFTTTNVAQGVFISLVANGAYMVEQRGDLSVNGRWLVEGGGFERIQQIADQPGSGVDLTRIPVPLNAGETVVVQKFDSVAKKNTPTQPKTEDQR